MKSGLAQMAKGGVVMDVTNAEQAKIAEQAGVCFPLCLSTRLPHIKKNHVGHIVSLTGMRALHTFSTI